MLTPSAVLRSPAVAAAEQATESSSLLGLTAELQRGAMWREQLLPNLEVLMVEALLTLEGSLPPKKIVVVAAVERLCAAAIVFAVGAAADAAASA